MSSDAEHTIRELLAADLSAVAASAEGRLIGAVLCGHDGRRGTVHHLAVSRSYRRRGVAKRLLEHCLGRLEQARIPRCNVFLYDANEEGARFWVHNGWEAAATWKTLQRRVGREPR
ncbi:MAG TPA: GNAT family N-acetyltransferase [Myxococcota bacterium]|jgi:putative acetyltransferase